MVLVKKWPFFPLFFLDNKGQENVFYDILERISSISILAKPQFNHGITYLSTP